MSTPDLDALLAQAQAMHDRVVSVRDDLDASEVTGVSADGAVAVGVSMSGVFRSVRVGAEVVAAGPEAVEDAVLDALRDASRQLRASAEAQLGGLQQMFDGLLRPPTA